MIFDVHVHLPSPGWPRSLSFFKTVTQAIAYLRKAGIQGAIFNTWQGVLAKNARDLDQANRAALRLAKRHAGFLYPAAVIHPDFPKASEFWLRCFRDQGLGWVGELVPRPLAQPYTDAAFLRLAERCAEYGHILHLHYHPDLIRLAKRIPQCRIVAAHIPEQSALHEIARLPNLWLDIAGQAGGIYMGYLERAVATVGVTRLLFGTDFDGYEPRAFIERVRAVVASSCDRRKIFETNVRALLSFAFSKKNNSSLPFRLLTFARDPQKNQIRQQSDEQARKG